MTVMLSTLSTPDRRPLEVELAEVRRFGITMRYATTEYQVLHPYPLVAKGLPRTT